jgi:hypothetical protein
MTDVDSNGLPVHGILRRAEEAPTSNPSLMPIEVKDMDFLKQVNCVDYLEGKVRVKVGDIFVRRVVQKITRARSAGCLSNDLCARWDELVQTAIQQDMEEYAGKTLNEMVDEICGPDHQSLVKRREDELGYNNRFAAQADWDRANSTQLERRQSGAIDICSPPNDRCSYNWKYDLL